MHAQREIRAVWSDWLTRVWRYVVGLVLVTVMGAVLMHFVVPDALAPYAVGATVASGAWVGYVVWLDCLRSPGPDPIAEPPAEAEPARGSMAWVQTSLAEQPDADFTSSRDS